MTENQPTTAEPHDPSGTGTPGTENPSTGSTSSSTGTTGGAAGSSGPTSGYGPPPQYAPPPQYPPARPPLRRSRNDRVLSGVCGGLAASLGIDAVLIRILMVVGTVFTGGALIIAYIIAWVLMPDEPAYVPVYVGQAAQPQYATAGAPSTPSSFAAGGTGTYVDPATGAVYGATAPPTALQRTEPRSYLGLVTLCSAVVAGGLLALLGALGLDVSGLVVAAVLLLVIGVGLLVGARYGRARWLIAPAIVMLLVVQGAAAVQNVVDSSGSGVGDRTWVPTSTTSSFELGAGSGRLDLTQLPAGHADVSVDVGLGEIVVIVPADTEVVLAATVGAGEIDLPTQRNISGTNLTVDRTIPASTTATTTVELDASVGLGTLEVRRASS